MEAFSTLTGVAARLDQDDINTDQIAPASGHGMNPDYGKFLFGSMRYAKNGSDVPEFVLNKPQFRDTKILVTGRNFGCGSSRESAVWAFVGYGIRCIVAPSFADIFRENCLKNGVLPITLGDAELTGFRQRITDADGSAPFTADLEKQHLSGPGGSDIAFDIAPAERHALMEGLDDIGLTLAHVDDIFAWEQKIAGARPWLQSVMGRSAK